MNWVSIGSGNGLSPVWHQAINWTNADLFSNGPTGTNLCEIQIKIQNYLHENTFENVCKTAAILFRGRWVNWPNACVSISCWEVVLCVCEGLLSAKLLVLQSMSKKMDALWFYLQMIKTIHTYIPTLMQNSGILLPSFGGCIWKQSLWGIFIVGHQRRTWTGEWGLMSLWPYSIWL